MASPYVLLKSALFTVFVPGLVAWVIPQWLARRESPELPINRRLSKRAGWLSLITGVGLYLHTVWRFADEGGGTPAPWDEPNELVGGGVYAYSRNPMYLGVILIVLGQALLYRSAHVLWWAVGCWLGFHHRVVDWEEPHLRKKHGEAYEQYCDDVPRWVPRIRP
ncbi:isoprenylcysteine carboxylmethyltransferase family protein [Natronococcus sp. A-GB1]|uniref:methyltransferase family protein n=1 Tax=Natronococcus sp. A-GB1 TaxID=3037648 RepID=UPI00241D0047|nr:isoprenylcysteine carboxylmethyltransferase family protein [Natronococcus sp. A-GB1]MDG5761211.1 isoprenylcysteine carboxylmethyltransferase family protein [Natronococcus sp. A-GB1]